jgi:hypothetical protein
MSGFCFNGYANWERFKDAIHRAFTSGETTGLGQHQI